MGAFCCFIRITPTFLIRLLLVLLLLFSLELLSNSSSLLYKENVGRHDKKNSRVCATTSKTSFFGVKKYDVDQFFFFPRPPSKAKETFILNSLLRCIPVLIIPLLLHVMRTML